MISISDKFDNFINNIGIGVVITTLLGGLLVVSPILSVATGWFTGLIIKLFFGTYIANGFNLLFNTARFEPNHIPMLCSALAVVGSYFRSVQMNKK